MNTDRTFDPTRQEDINATRRINVGPSTVRPASSTIRPASATVRPASSTIRSSAMMGGSVRPNSLATPDDNVDDKYFLLKGNKYKNIQSLSEDTGEAQVFLVERDGEKYVLKIYYPNFDVNKKVLQTVYNFDFEMIVKVYDFGKTWPIVISAVSCIRISSRATSSSVIRNIQSLCLETSESPASWIRTERLIRPHRPVPLSMLHQKCTPM